ncbi:DNA mismatch repair protein MutL [Aerococcus urinaehominis]|uniref:DNA mismatch repair protein MutL n=1 Tax=Aerococcus urinaehominis TaxID=128944 RepID=A0A0X8FLT9_9LACT|nr:DNA mismatch repair endonuclease MutL [Aerococcus urinaehominis]AMB99692.1 DNA mismatch repair protein MutL [Aerococcus urinaehominis]SDL90754.1 DNA mismatch repair protein MutL [Aerococcus urinaehominis]
MAIHELAPQVANQIAAGEVVERPASVVKELLENAIDAGASQIEIQVEEAGLRAIQVTDNGCGMNAADSQLAFKRHATSKISRSHDLFRIHTLGFRGEALPSIASVAEVQLESSDGERGQLVYAQAGEIIAVEPSHLRQGTTVRVENLFYNTPARLKYIKSLNTELSHITDIVNRMALGHPDIQFTYSHDGQQILATNGKNRLQEVLAAVYGYKTAKDMIAISGELLDIKLSGYVSLPQLTRARRNYMSIFLNGRYIKNYLLNQAIEKGYGSKLMVGRYPIAALHIEMDPQLVDVNVHPTKQEVRISKEKDLYDLVIKAIDQVLAPRQRIPRPLEAEGNHEASKHSQQEKNSQLNLFSPASNLIKEVANLSEPGQSEPGSNYGSDYGASLSNHAAGPSPSLTFDSIQTEGEGADKFGPVSHALSKQDIPSRHQQDVWTTVKKVKQQVASQDNRSFPQLDYIGQLHGTYLLASTPAGFYMVDQHAAQERIKYEFYRQSITSYGDQLQDLLIPIVLEFPSDQALVVKDLQSDLADMGIKLESFGPNTFILNHHPLWMGEQHIEEIVHDLIDLLLIDPEASLADYREATAIMMSCKRSIKANHYLDDRQARQLLADLATCENPYNCPHGRPVLIFLSNYDIERMFKRIQDPH